MKLPAKAVSLFLFLYLTFSQEYIFKIHCFLLVFIVARKNKRLFFSREVNASSPVDFL